ncbi:hypothetical protein Tco_0091738 [Tanacetum coccineum]
MTMARDTYRKTPLRLRNIPATPAMRNKKPNLLTKIVDRANKLFRVVFGDRNLYEIERLTRLGDGDKANISNDSHVLRLKASKSGPLNKHAEEEGETSMLLRITPSANAVTLYSRPSWETGRLNGSRLFNQAVSSYGNLRGQMASRCLVKSRSSVLVDLVIWWFRCVDLGIKHRQLISSSACLGILMGQIGSKMAGKRRSYVLDDLGSGGLMRRIWQKADLCSQKKKRPFQMSAREDDLI